MAIVDATPAAASPAKTAGAGRIRPLRADAERNRRRILDAARELFAARGFGVTLDDIARHAKVGVGTVYRRFPCREAIVDELFEAKVTELTALADAAGRQDDAWLGLTGFLAAAGERLAGDRGLRDVCLTNEYGRDRVAVARARLAPAIAALVARAVEQGTARHDLQPTDVAATLRMIETMAEFGRTENPLLWKRYLHLLMDGMRADGRSADPLPVPALDEDALERAMSQPR